MYFESITDVRSDYLVESPKKADVLSNARINGRVSILPNSNNRAITIDTGDRLYLQSYDTLILCKDKHTGDIEKLWNGYSVTTLKRINTFLGSHMGKHQWLSLGTSTTFRID